MKNTLLHISFLLFISMSVQSTARAGVMDEIANAIKNGNAKDLAGYFDSNLLVTILDEEETYSKAQAELVVKDFFSKHSPRSFEIVHSGESAGGSQQYSIGILTCANGTFRVYINIKSSGSTYVIQELSFEEQ